MHIYDIINNTWTVGMPQPTAIRRYTSQLYIRGKNLMNDMFHYVLAWHGDFNKITYITPLLDYSDIILESVETVSFMDIIYPDESVSNAIIYCPARDDEAMHIYGLL